MKLVYILLLISGSLFAQTAHEYFKNASFLYIQSKIDQALLETEEGLKKYPTNTKLEMLKERIEEIKKEQEEQQKQNKDQQQNQDQQDQEDQQDKEKQNEGQQSSDQNSSQAESDEKKPQEPQEPQGEDSTAAPEPQPQEGELTPEQAEELLQNFNEEESKDEPEKWNRESGQRRPLKDW